MRHPDAAARRSPGPRQGHPAGVAHHRGPRRHRRSAHQGRRRVRDTSVLGRTFYLMGFVDGWSPMDKRGKWPEPFDTDLEAGQACVSTGRGHRAAVEGRLARPGSAGPGRPDGFHERQVERWIGFLERIEARIPGLEVATEVAADAQATRLRPGPDARRLPVRERDVPARRPGPMAALVDWEMGTVGDPKLDLGWMVQSWPKDPRPPRPAR